MGVQDHEPLSAIVGSWKRLPNRGIKSDQQETEVTSTSNGPTAVILSGLCIDPNLKLEETTNVTKHDEPSRVTGYARKIFHVKPLDSRTPVHAIVLSSFSPPIKPPVTVSVRSHQARTSSSDSSAVPLTFSCLCRRSTCPFSRSLKCLHWDGCTFSGQQQSC